MGTHPVLKLCYRLLFFLALGHAVVTESEEDVALLPDEICPCIVLEECPRVFGASPEDGLLGSFSPCEDPDSVRCCGVSSRVSVAHSVSSSAGSEKSREKESVRLIPGGTVVPVPLSLPEYVDPRKTTELTEVENYEDVYEDESGSDERITDVDEYLRGDELTAEERERELNSGATLRGENIDDHTGLQTDASLSPDYLDYPGVNKHRIKGGTTQTNTGSRQRGEISSSKRVESTSSSSSASSLSSSDKKNESIVAVGDNGSPDFGRTSETRPKLLVEEEDEEEQFETPEIIEQKVTYPDLIDSRISQRRSDGAENDSEFMQGRFGASSRNSIVPVDADLVEVDESRERTTGFVRQPLQNRRNFVGDTSTGLGNDRFNQFRPDFRGQTVFRNQETSSQQKNDKVSKESTSFEENSSSSFTLADEKMEDFGTSRRPTTRLNSGGQTERKESTNLEENTSSDIESETTNTRELPEHDASLISQPAEEQQTESLMQQKSQSIQKESSSLEKSTSSEVETSSLNTKPNDNASSEYLGPISVDQPIHVQREETTSTQTKSETMSKGSSSDEENTSSNVIKVDTIGEIPSGFETGGEMDEGNNQHISSDSKGNTVHEQRSGTPTNEETKSASSESSSLMENLSATSNPMNLVTGKTSSVAEGSSKSTEIGNRSENAWVWHVGNRAYVPVLINAGFLRDRPTATGRVGLDPLSGVTHTDVLDPDLAPELLPLLCGNVVSGEGSEAKQTVVCDIPGDSVSPIRFLAGDQKAVNLEKPEVPAGGEQRLETDNAEQSGSVEIKEDVTNRETKDTRVENSTMIDSMTSESHSKESSTTTTVDAINDSRQEVPRRRVIARRPVQVTAVEERREEEAVVLPTTTKKVHRGRNRHVTDRLESRPAIDGKSNTVVKNKGEIGSRQVARGSVSTSSRSLNKATSSQESMSSNSKQEITTSEFDVPLERKNSRFYMAPEKMVEAIDVVPSANSRVSKKRFRNLASAQKVSPQNLEVPSMTTFEENDANVEEAESVHDGETDSRRPGFFYRRQSRRANSFAPEVEAMTISPDELSMTGRINIVGPIPAGFKDPALGTREEIPMELPKKIGLYALKAAANSRQQVVERTTEPFRPSPVDPINH